MHDEKGSGQTNGKCWKIQDSDKENISQLFDPCFGIGSTNA